MWNGSGDLTEREQVQINMLFWRVFKVHEEIHYQYLDGEMDESVWTGFKNTIASSAANQAFRSTPVLPDMNMVSVDCDTQVDDNQTKESEL